MNQIPKIITPTEADALLDTLKARFEKNRNRHSGLLWENVVSRLQTQPAKLWSLQQMENSGGEPDVVTFDESTGELVFYDCSPESPAGRRSLCYDRDALDARKEFKPENSAVDMAAEMGITLMDEAQYRHLQQFGHFDAKTSSWLLTPEAIRKHGGAIFGDYRYAHVFVYHNGAQSYYAARGFRGVLRV